MLLLLFFLPLLRPTVAFPSSPRSLATSTFSTTGLASFNNFAAQNGDGSTVCQPSGPGKPTVGTSTTPVFSAAINDLSLLWNTTVGPDNLCGGPSLTNDTAQCSPSPLPAPGCPSQFISTFCDAPQCFQLTNQGVYTGKAGVPDTGVQGLGAGNSVVVQIIDACPVHNPSNFCGSGDTPPDWRCSDSNQQFDVDVGAYPALTEGLEGPQDLAIGIEQVACPGAAPT